MLAAMDSFADYRQQQQHQQQQGWPAHMQIHQGPFPSPPASEHGHAQHYPQYFQQQQQQASQQQQQQQQQQQSQQQQPQQPPDSARSPLSLNIASLTVASPTNLSPINPSTSAAVNAVGVAGVLSPVTPISPSNNPFHHPHAAHAAHSHSQHIQSPFAYDPNQNSAAAGGQHSPNSRHYDDHGMMGSTIPPAGSSAGGFDSHTLKRTRSSSSNNASSAGGTQSAQLSRKSSATMHPNASSASQGVNSGAGSAPGSGGGVVGPSTSSSGINGPSPSSTSPSGGASSSHSTRGLRVNVNVSSTLMEEESGMYDDEARDEAMALASAQEYDDLEVRAAYVGGPGGSGSPIDGSGSTSGEETFGMINMGTGGMGGSMGIIGKPMGTNNFVTKLYQMISDPKSAQFIAWTELGTSFVVQNVGEFSRSILGSHFKHNNFSSFVRQLNMYGFHKINRTPRAQRTSTDAQTWEFSHHKFLRGRPDLLDEIKRKALEPDPGIKHRIELPGEVAAQLNMMKEEVRRVSNEYAIEKRKREKVTHALSQLWTVVDKAFPGALPPFSMDLLDNDSPNIYITSPTSTTGSRFPPPLSMNLHSIHGLSSPTSSPTAADFPSHNMHSHHGGHGSHPLSRQHSYQHMARGDSSSSTPLPSSPGSISMDLFDDGSCDPPSGRAGTKRQRLDESGSSASGPGNGMNVSINSSIGGSETNMSMMSSVSSPGGVGANGGLASLAVPKKSVRARSDSAPLGYVSNATGMHSWGAGPSGLGAGSGLAGGMNAMGGAGRPRSGSGMVRGVPNIGNMTRGNGQGGTPLLSLSNHGDTGMNR